MYLANLDGTVKNYLGSKCVITLTGHYSIVKDSYTPHKELKEYARLLHRRALLGEKITSYN